MECPVCYVEYDTGAFKPKVNFCGHTICSACIKRIRECCICKKPINHERPENRCYLPNISRSSRVDFFPSHYLRNSLGSGEQEAQIEPKDNFALIEVIEKQTEEKRQRENYLSQATFWCVDCKAILSKSEMDRQHSLHKGHNLRFVDPDIFKLYYEIQDTDRNITTAINDHEVNLIQLTRIAEEQEKMASSVPEKIAQTFDEFITMLHKAKQDIQDLFLQELKKKQQQTEDLSNESATLCKILSDMRKNLSELREKMTQQNFNVDEQKEKQSFESQSSSLEDLIAKRYSSEHIENNCKVDNPLSTLKKLFKSTLSKIPKQPIAIDSQGNDLDLTFDPLETNLASFSKNANQVSPVKQKNSNRETQGTFQFNSTQTCPPIPIIENQGYLTEPVYLNHRNHNDTFEELNNRRIETRVQVSEGVRDSQSNEDVQDDSHSFSNDEFGSERINGINASDRSLEYRRRDDSIDLDYMDTMYHAYGGEDNQYPSTDFPPY